MSFRSTPLFKVLLANAERLYGKRSTNHKFTIKGRDSLTPETILDPAAGEVTIWFANEARHDYDRLRLQLAHEVIHVLCGGFKRQCLTFEEGLAVQFSLSVSTEAYAKNTSRRHRSWPRLSVCASAHTSKSPETLLIKIEVHAATL